MNPLVTIIVPVYNTSPFIERCVQSIVAQSYARWQLILVDDGSTDGSAELCSQLADNAERIEFLAAEHKGVGAARNLALDHARGEFICFIDSDDYVEKDYLQQLVAKSKYDLVLCGYFGETNDAALNMKAQSRCIPVQIELNDMSDKRPLLPLFRKGMIHINCNKLFRRSIIEREHIRYKQYPINEDYIFIITYLRHCHSFCSIATPLYHWCRHEGLKTSVDSIPSNLLGIYNEAHRKTIAFFQDKNIADEIMYYSYNLIIHKFLKLYHMGIISKDDAFARLNLLHKNSMVKDAYRAYSPSTCGERLIYYLERMGFFKLSDTIQQWKN